MKYLYPEDHQKIADLLASKKNEREQYIVTIISETEQLLKKNDIAAEVSGRNKHLFSIWRKGRIKQLKFEEILDLIGIRIIVDSVENCYKVLGLIQARYIQLAKGFKDYITQPKENGYQSLHLNVINEDERTIEIQIRTKEMHLIAEEGIAAHWHYKEEYGRQKKDRSGKPYTAIDDSVKRNVIWIRNFLKEQKQENPELFLKSLKLNLYSDIIVVRSPENKYIKLKKNSTPLDFAFKLHTDIGLHCIGAYINGKHKPIRTILQNGDVVKVLTSPQAKPSKDWITILTSVKARQKVRQYFRNIEIQELVEQGKEIFYKRIRKLPVKVKSNTEILALARQFKLSDSKSFFAKLGSGEIDFQEIKQVLLPEEKDNVNTEEESDNILPTGDISMPAIVLENIDNLMIRFAKCCDPQPGDKIVGYTTRGKGITIHRDSCSNKGFTNLRKKEPERIMPVKWKKKLKASKKDLVPQKQHKN